MVDAIAATDDVTWGVTIDATLLVGVTEEFTWVLPESIVIVVTDGDDSGDGKML